MFEDPTKGVRPCLSETDGLKYLDIADVPVFDPS